MEISENFHFPRFLNTVVHEDFGFNRSIEIREKWILTQRGNCQTLLIITTGYYQFRTPLRVENWTCINTVGTRFN